LYDGAEIIEISQQHLIVFEEMLYHCYDWSGSCL